VRRRVVITGMGVVSPVGNDVETFWKSLVAGRSGVSFITEFPTDKLRSDVCASVRDIDVSKYLSAKDADVHGRVTHLSVAAAVEAVAQSGIETGVDRTRVGVLFSTGQGAVDVFEAQILKSHARGPRAVSPYFIPAVMLNAPAAVLATRWGFMGPSYNIASACSTGTHSIATSAMMIEAGDADVMIAGGAEAATMTNTVAGFGNARALARAIDGDPTRASRPFDVRRHGFVMGEGAGALVLEAEDHARARGAKPLAVVAGWGSTTDANHVTRPHPEGKGLALALTAALRRAGIGSADVDYVNPHATSTPQGDVAEYLALKTIFGDRLRTIPISATKSMIGHLLGGAGAVESIAVVCSLRDGRLHPSINVDELDPVFELDLVRESRPVPVRRAVKLSAGFGGHNCVLVLERAE
jgi:3-oxoacyl-[acyl-carrier-protein] synthase II